MSVQRVRFEPYRACLVTVLFVVMASQGLGQEPSSPQAVTMANTERRLLKSRVNGVDYQIDVALPHGYATSQKRYAVMYMLDGNVFFPLLTSSYRLASSLVPEELIVVGIGYPVKDFGFWSREYNTSRARDYTTKPAKPAGGVSAGAGGAPVFLRFLREELIPFIDSTYRTVPSDRGLMGHSYGGLFVAYALTHVPSLFQKYALGSPALWWDGEAGLRWESEYAAEHTEMRARVYIYGGAIELDGMNMMPARRFWEALKIHHYVGLDLVDFVTVPDEDHTSVTLRSFEHALRSLYAPPPVFLPVGVLRRYVGEWKTGDEPAWAARLDHGRLLIDIPSLPKYDWVVPQQRVLLAESEVSFYSELGDIRIVFTVDTAEGFATEMRVTVDGYASTLRKATGNRPK